MKSLYRSFAFRTARPWFVGLALVVLALVVAACAPSAAQPPAQAPAAQAPAAQAPTTAPSESAYGATAPNQAPAATTAPSAAAGPAMVMVAKNDQLGSYLVDAKGMALYMYTKDTPNTSNCYDKCATAWPPLLTSGAPQAGAGADASLLGTTTRTDGSTQVTYKGMPLYYFAKDKESEDVYGQGVGSVWYVVSPAGDIIKTAAAAATAPAATAAPAAATTAGPAQAVSGPAMLQVAQNGTLGSFLVDNKGMTLYIYTKDTPNTSNCYDKCATAWPPLLTSGAAQAGAGVDASLLGTTTRKDGSTQVTYKSMPLYYWFKDTKPGDTNGQWVGGVWFVVSPAGEIIKAGQPAATAAPSSGASATAAPAAAAPAAAGQSVQVSMKGFAFNPQTVTISVGGTVQWLNDDAAFHTVTADDGSFDSGQMATNATFSHTFDKPGTYPYYCLYHGGKGGKGMSGVVVVK